jgi:hypothetical protein
MSPEVKENRAFANWLRDWIAAIKQSCASVEANPHPVQPRRPEVLCPRNHPSLSADLHPPEPFPGKRI